MKWLGDHDVRIELLSVKDIMLGILVCKDDLFINHILLLAKRSKFRMQKSHTIFQSVHCEYYVGFPA